MFCDQCGGFVGHGDLFCARCGAGVTAGYPAVPTPQQPPRRRPAAAFWVIGVILAVAAGVTAGVAFTRHDHASRPAAAAARRSSASPVAASSSAGSSTTRPSPTASLSLSQIYARQQSGVVRIETLGCGDAQGVGTGFLLSSTLVATVDHVVADSVVVSLVDGDQRTTGEVIGHDDARDLALVRASAPLTGFHFHLATSAPQVGDQVAAIGFPIGDPITLTQGNISGLDRNIDVEGARRTGMLETDAAVNPGNSGGPLMEPDGSVIGLVDALNTEANGIAYAVPASQARPDIAQWSAAPSAEPAAHCDNPTGPSAETGAVSSIPGLPSDVASGVTTALNTYFGGINSGDYASAFSTYSDRLQSQTSVASLAAGDADSVDFGQMVITARMASDGSARVALSFTSLQSAAQGPGHSGDTCDNWTLVYTMVSADDGTWRIDGTKPYHGSAYTSC